ncbi:MAG: serine hydrolase domain-containing protein, partial [Phycisphaerae bacterium]
NITVRHLLTHTAGLRLVDTGWPETTWPELIARLCGARLEPNWVPGEKAGYHAFSTWYLLGELIRVIDGRDVAEFVRAEVFAPLGMRDCYLALPAEAQAELGKRLVVMHNSFKGPPEPMATEVPAVLAQCRPGGSGRGPMRELAKFYRALVMEGAGIWTPPVVAALTARHRVGLYDHSFKKPMDWGLGVMLNSNYLNEGEHPYGFGPGVSLRTFGHGGYQSVGSFADPVTGLVVCYVFVGMPGERRHEARRVAFLRALREDVGGV